jgi:hypothetical protein
VPLQAFEKDYGNNIIFLCFESSKTARENLLLMFTASAKTFSSPCLTPRSLETGKKRPLGTYAAGNTAYQAHKTKLGQSEWVCTHTLRGCSIGTHPHKCLSGGIVSCVTKLSPTLPKTPISLQEQLTVKNRTCALTARSHQWHQL